MNSDRPPCPHASHRVSDSGARRCCIAAGDSHGNQKRCFNGDLMVLRDNHGIPCDIM